MGAELREPSDATSTSTSRIILSDEQESKHKRDAEGLSKFHRAEVAVMGSATMQASGASTELAISGMTCASCVAHVGTALRKVPGVADAAVNLATERANITHDPAVGSDELIKAVEAAGYGALVIRDEQDDDDARHRDAGLRRKRRLLVLALALFVPTIVLGMAPFDFSGKDWVMLLLTLPIWLIVGAEFHRGAIAALRRGTSNMDTLVSLGSSAALGYSIYATLAAKPAYYETAAAIVTLIFIGKYLEAAAKGRSNRALRALLDLRPAKARVVQSDGRVDDISIERVSIGAKLIVAAGERVPVDGVVEEGESAIDASMLTGESFPIDVSPGSAVKQGTLNGHGTIIVRAQAVGQGTTLARIVELVRRAQGTTPQVQRLADRVAGVFVPSILLVSAATFLAWFFTQHPWPTALSAAIAVLVVACPCALGLATPTAIIAAVEAAASRGILFRDAHAVERLGAVTTVMFDKTGTLTSGKPRVRTILPARGQTDASVLRAAAALEQASTHPLASAIVRAANDRGMLVPPASNVTATRGGGLQGSFDGETYRIGNEHYVTEHGAQLDGLAQSDATRVYLTQGSQLVGAIDVSDAIRPASEQAIEQLAREGIDVQLVSGDAQAPTLALAEQLHIRTWYAHVTPERKAEIVMRERQSGARIAFVGDGINDAPALASADVGIAMGAGTEIALETAQAAIISNDPRAVWLGIELSRATLRTIKQNLVWALAYNVILIPLAAVGIVHPILAAGAMGASSLFVVGNSLLLRRRARFSLPAQSAPA
jgi:P-type Cu+ transporter